MKMMTAIKSCIFLALATASVGAMAGTCGCYNRTCDDPIYVGNPNRPDTIWVPGHYTQSGCWKEGYYIKFNRTVCNGEVVWMGDHYDYAHPYRPVRGQDVALHNYYNDGRGYGWCGHCMHYKYKHHHRYYYEYCGCKHHFVNNGYNCRIMD